MDLRNIHYERAFNELNRIRTKSSAGEISFEVGEVFFHAGQTGFSFDNQKSLWTSQDINECKDYLKWDWGIGLPDRNIYRLTVTRKVMLVLFKENFTGEFCYNFCNASHTELAKILTAWGGNIKAGDGFADIHGITYEGRDEYVFFRSGNVLEVELTGS